MKDEEKRFLRAVADEHGGPYHGHGDEGGNPDARNAGDIGVSLGIHQKRVMYLLEKWNGRYADYGVGAWHSWLTPEG